MIGILGASGYIGRQFTEELISQGTVFREYNRSRDNYYDLKSLIDLIHKDQLTVLINCAGYTGKPNVDACESDKTACWNLNVIMPVMIENVCKQNNIQFIHISSGCIYNGYDRRWSEDDPSNFGLQNKSSSWYSYNN